MKKIGAILLGLTLTLMGCSTAETTSSGLSYIEPANLSEQEIDIANLFMNNGKDYIFDFSADRNIQSVQFQVDELENGQWIKKKGAGGLGFMEVGREHEGRILLKCNSLAEEGGFIAITNGDGKIECGIKGEENIDTNMMKASSIPLKQKKEIEYEKEIPLFMEFWDKEAVSVPTADPFADPQAFVDADCDHIYMITATFSQKPVGKE